MKILPTEETYYYNQYGYSAEAIDKMLHNNLIDEEQLRAGITLRILRYKKYGKAHSFARDYSHNGGRENFTQENEDDIINQQIFKESLEKLNKIQATKDVLDLCVHNITPKTKDKLDKIKDGLNLLAVFYKKNFFSY